MSGKIYFIAGIDTDAGKSFATGWLAKKIMQQGLSVITQKFVQTGCKEWSEDIEIHRQIMGTGMLEDDLNHLTAPLVFTHPCSPQLAAQIDNRVIDLELIDKSASTLSKKYNTVLLEAAGGLMVPLTDDFLTIDYVESRKFPVILVTNAKLGSISHTVLALEAIKHRNIELDSVLFNNHFNNNDPIIAKDTRSWIERYVSREFPGIRVIDVPTISI